MSRGTVEQYTKLDVRGFHKRGWLGSGATTWTWRVEGGDQKWPRWP